MADERYPKRRSGGLLTPVLAALVLIGALVLAIAYRTQVWRFLRWLGHVLGGWFTDWVPAHRGQTLAIAGFAVVAFVLNWLAHIRGRLRAWIFALVIEIALWLLFWFRLGIPSLNELFGLNLAKLKTSEVLISGVLVIAVTGALFWYLEAREEWLVYRRRHHVEED
jgi:hypothetical protein